MAKKKKSTRRLLVEGAVILAILYVLAGADLVAKWRIGSKERDWNSRVKAAITPGMTRAEAENQLKSMGLSTRWDETDYTIVSHPGGVTKGFMVDYSLNIEIKCGPDNHVLDSRISEILSTWM